MPPTMLRRPELAPTDELTARDYDEPTGALANILKSGGMSFNPDDNHFESLTAVHGSESGLGQDVDNTRYRRDLNLEDAGYDQRLAGLEAATRRASQFSNPEFEDAQMRRRAGTMNDLANTFSPDANARARNATLSGARTASDVYFMPGQSAMRENANEAALARALGPARITAEGNVAGHELDLEGKLAEAMARGGQNDVENNKAFMGLYGDSMKSTASPSPEQQQMLQAIFQQLMQRMKFQVPGQGQPPAR